MQRSRSQQFFLQENSRQAIEGQSASEESTRNAYGLTDDCDVAIADGWRYLRLTPREIESLTPREFAILMSAENEARMDEYELLAVQAMMIEKRCAILPSAKAIRPQFFLKRSVHQDYRKRAAEKATLFRAGAPAAVKIEFR